MLDYVAFTTTTTSTSDWYHLSQMLITNRIAVVDCALRGWVDCAISCLGCCNVA